MSWVLYYQEQISMTMDLLQQLFHTLLESAVRKKCQYSQIFLYNFLTQLLGLIAVRNNGSSSTAFSKHLLCLMLNRNEFQVWISSIKSFPPFLGHILRDISKQYVNYISHTFKKSIQLFTEVTFNWH